nr:MAG TPA: hypothetical protein [Caudoviricetes sp.]
MQVLRLLLMEQLLLLMALELEIFISIAKPVFYIL